MDLNNLPPHLRRRYAQQFGMKVDTDGTVGNFSAFDQGTAALQEKIATSDSVSTADTARLIAREGPNTSNRRVVDSGEGTVVGNAVQRGLASIN